MAGAGCLGGSACLHSITASGASASTQTETRNVLEASRCLPAAKGHACVLGKMGWDVHREPLGSWRDLLAVIISRNYFNVLQKLLIAPTAVGKKKKISFAFSFCRIGFVIRET